MPDSPIKKALILRSFNDAGTGKSFKRGHIVPMNAGVFANYAAAGLVRDAPPPSPPPATAPAPGAAQPAP